MAASLEEEERRRDAAAGSTRGREELGRFGDSPLLKQLSQSICPNLLAESGAWSPLLKLLDLEFKCCRKW